MRSGCISSTRICDTESGAVLATAEQMLLHVDSAAGKATPAAPAVLDKANAIAAAHSNAPLPEEAGRHVGQSTIRRSSWISASAKSRK